MRQVCLIDGDAITSVLVRVDTDFIKHINPREPVSFIVEWRGQSFSFTGALAGDSEDIPEISFLVSHDDGKRILNRLKAQDGLIALGSC